MFEREKVVLEIPRVIALNMEKKWREVLKRYQRSKQLPNTYLKQKKITLKEFQ